MTREETLGKYAQLMTQKRALEKEIKELAPAILQAIENEGATKLDTPLGIFATETRKAWVFSPKVAELEAAVEAQVKTEKQDGTATYTETKLVKFYLPKNDETNE